jgi:pSer/pThr/pTyr-binding forkhead associated (FHA) protein
MPRVTFRVLDGADRGRTYPSLEPPITIGREEGNTIQLNDERVSRYHAKIQMDHEQVVLTDLESTNGTKVNGEDVQLRNLRFGDVVQVGRTVMVFGTREQISQRLKDLCNGGRGQKRRPKTSPLPAEIPSSESGVPWKDQESIQAMFFELQPPDLPDRLSPGQAAQLAEVIEYLTITIRHLLECVREEKGERVSLDACQWQNLVDLQCRLAEYLRKIGEPDSDSP